MSAELCLAVPDAQTTALDMQLAKSIGDTLLRFYPNHLWLVEVKQGVATVRNLNLSGRWGFIIKTTDAFSATDLDRRLKIAGGEILERYRLTREKSSGERISDKVLALATDFAGNTVFDK